MHRGKERCHQHCLPLCVCVYAYCQAAFGLVGGQGRGRGRTAELFEMPVEL